MDRSVLDEMPIKERRRQEAIFELIATEAAYVRDLQLIVEVCIFHIVMCPATDVGNRRSSTAILSHYWMRKL